MNIIDIENQLREIIRKLPPYYSQNSAKELLDLFNSYKGIVEALPEDYRQIKYGVSTEFSAIKFDIEWAIKGTPKKEAESRFATAKANLKDDIDSIISELKQPTA